MIKLGVGPLGGLVASRTIIAHGLRVRAFIVVTVDTIGWRFTVLFVLGVTITTFAFEVSTDEFKIGERVVKSVFDKFDDIGLSAFMVGMAH